MKSLQSSKKIAREGFKKKGDFQKTAWVFASDDIRDLPTIKDILDKEWQSFKQSLVDEQQARIDKRNKGLRKFRPGWRAPERSPFLSLDSKGGQRFSTDDTFASVRDAETSWKSKPRWARIQQNFHKFCGTLSSHSNLMKCLPDQNLYLSIFCGVATTLIKVRLNLFLLV